MQVVILAAGRGVRMGELTNDVPKPLLNICGRPILEYTLMNLPREIDEVIFVVGYKGEMIRAYFGDNYNGRRINYAEQTEFNGTAGALLAAKDRLRDKFLVLMGDDLYHKNDLTNLLFHNLALLAKIIQGNTRFGVVDVDADECLKNIVEFKDVKREEDKDGCLVNTGAYILTRDIFDYPPARISEKEFGLPQTLAQMADKYRIKVEYAEIWHPNTNGSDLRKAEEIVRKYFKMD